MNMNKTEKLLAARRKLKEFQQNKTSSQDVSAVRKSHKKPSPPAASPKNIEPVLNREMESSLSPEKRMIEIVRSLPKVSAFSDDGNVINPTEPNESSSDFDSRLVPEPCELRSDAESEATEKRPGCEKTAERNTNTDGIDEFRVIQDSVQIVPERVSPLPSASPPETISFPDTEIGHSPSTQKEHLLKMASAVADALIDNSECPSPAAGENDPDPRNDYMSSCLQEQKQLVNQLRARLSQYSSRVSELETVLATKDCEFEARLLREVNPLKEQLLVHAQTTGILVAEKAELSAAIEECRAIARRKAEEVEEANGRLRTSQNRVVELDKEVSHMRSIVDDTRKTYQQLHLDYAELERRHEDLRKSKDDDELEASELRQELSLKNAENLNLKRELEDKNTLLSLNNLKIQQLTNTPQDIEALEGQHKALTILEQQLSQTRDALKSVSRDKDDAAKQYENYVRQLESRNEKTVKELEETLRKVEILQDRESSYIQRLSDIEQSFQREKQRVEELLPMQDHEERIEHLTKSLDALSLEHANLQTALNERETEIEILKRDLEDARESREDSVDKVRLANALESEKLGASRAVSQNQQLKIQLNEMHDAFVTLSNSKLDLTEQLQAERAIGKKLNARLNKVEDELEELREQLRQKTVTIDDMEREKLQTAQIADQMHHYQAQSNQARTLQQELQNSLGCIEILRRENQQLSAELNRLREEEMRREKGMSNGVDGVEEKIDNENLGKIVSDSMKTSIDGVFAISNPSKRLETRFKETMERLAELTDEKQRLEHLVLQLQGETETIGEYITLYQKQRAILQKKAEEREETFRQLVEQRNYQQEQLHKLKVLVADLIKKKSTNRLDAGSKSSSFIEFENEREETHEIDPQRNNLEDSVIDLKDKTTSEILDLLTEIKDCKDTCILEPNFHPCPWCSGKLITV